MSRWVLALLLLTAIGCGGESYPLAPVSGVVLLDGRPLADARVSFEPRRSGEGINAGPGSYGKTDAEGRYVLETLDGDRGAVVATHDVTISTFQAKADLTSDEVEQVVMEEKVPAEYNRAGALSFPVPAQGTAAADFRLSTE